MWNADKYLRIVLKRGRKTREIRGYWRISPDPERSKRAEREEVRQSFHKCPELGIVFDLTPV
jgi:hypothetical protein